MAFPSCDWVINLIPKLGEMLLFSNDRANEYLADSYAVDLGYGEGLLSVLYRIHDMHLEKPQTLFERLKNSHPATSSRIKRIEEIIG